MKSFSVITKEELCNIKINNIDEAEAELSGILIFGAVAVGDAKIKLSTENTDVLERYRSLCEVLDIDEGQIVADNTARVSVIVGEGLLSKFKEADGRYRLPVSITEDMECRKSFIRGAFIGGGSIVDPNKNYNLEMVTAYEELSEAFNNLLVQTGFDFKRISRKTRYVLYVKRSEDIADFLTYIGAYKAQMELINITIEKGLRNDLNRSINSETANLEKTISASVRQIQAIELIKAKGELEDLPDELRELAELRIEHKSESLAKLGKMLEPPLGKSGVNHRFNRIMAIAERLEE